MHNEILHDLIGLLILMIQVCTCFFHLLGAMIKKVRLNYTGTYRYCSNLVLNTRANLMSKEIEKLKKICSFC
jgi:hypothetical protein